MIDINSLHNAIWLIWQHLPFQGGYIFHTRVAVEELRAHLAWLTRYCCKHLQRQLLLWSVHSLKNEFIGSEDVIFYWQIIQMVSLCNSSKKFFLFLLLPCAGLDTLAFNRACVLFNEELCIHFFPALMDTSGSVYINMNMFQHFWNNLKLSFSP